MGQIGSAGITSGLPVIGPESTPSAEITSCKPTLRTVPVPDWVRTELDDWLAAAAIDRGKLFRRVNKVGRTWGDGMTVKAVWHIVKESAKRIGVAKLAPHDLRRTCARLCHTSGGELDQIQFLLGHVSVQTTERYLGCKQRIRSAVNDRIGIEPNP
jgi:integrase